MCVCALVHAWHPQRPEENVGCSEPGVTDGCGLLRGCRESNAEPSLPVPLFPGFFPRDNCYLQADLELKAITLPQPLESCNYRQEPPHLVQHYCLLISTRIAGSLWQWREPWSEAQFQTKLNVLFALQL